MQKDTIENTLIILKPDAVSRGIVGEIITRFERAGLKLIACRMHQPSEEHFEHHYEKIGALRTRKGEEIFNTNLRSMMLGPVIAMVLRGVEAIDTVRKMVGPTEPKSAAPGTIRGDYAHVSYSHSSAKGVSIANIIHASASAEEAEAEIRLWFEGDEIFSEYKNVHTEFTQPQ